MDGGPWRPRSGPSIHRAAPEEISRGHTGDRARVLLTSGQDVRGTQDPRAARQSLYSQTGLGYIDEET
jgi:hypothetical protein